MRDKRTRGRIYLVLEDHPQEVSRWGWALLRLLGYPEMAGKVAVWLFRYWLGVRGERDALRAAKSELDRVEREAGWDAGELADAIKEQTGVGE